MAIGAIRAFVRLDATLAIAVSLLSFVGSQADVNQFVERGCDLGAVRAVQAGLDGEASLKKWPGLRRLVAVQVSRGDVVALFGNSRIDLAPCGRHDLEPLQDKGLQDLEAN